MSKNSLLMKDGDAFIVNIGIVTSVSLSSMMCKTFDLSQMVLGR